jgi:hypothetical protein
MGLVSGHTGVESVASSAGPASCKATRKCTGPAAKREDIRAARKSDVFDAATSAERNAILVPGSRRNRPTRLSATAFVNWNAVTAKFASAAKLAEMGFEDSTRAHRHVGREKHHDRRRARCIWPTGSHGLEELLKLLSGQYRVSVVRVSDDVSVDMVG